MKDISNATKTNWKKLKVDVSTKKLDKRANKRMSTKKILPIELFCNKDNIVLVKEIINKVSLLIPQYSLKQIMYNFILNHLKANKLIKNDFSSSKKSIQNYLNNYEELEIIEDILEIQLPQDEIDILGIIYQCLLSEGDKNEAGSYYTPNNIVNNMTQKITMNMDSKVIDPCCGTGMFLLDIKTENPENIYGVDLDEIAVMIAKINLIVKYKEKDFNPNIYHFDFIQNHDDFLKNIKFDYIITNPPWGANLDNIDKSNFKEITSGESFSYVLFKAINMISENGKIIFLLPESFLNVKIHADIRQYILKNIAFKEIVKYPTSFSGVVTKYISIYLEKTKTDNKIINIFDFNDTYFENVDDVLKSENFVITTNKEIDKIILSKVHQFDYETLENSTWGLGIVTGDNKSKLKKYKFDGCEEIYTGKEISDYNLLPCKNYIKYDRNNLQQVAPESIYRADEKLVYKFISKKITFAYDENKCLFLNSANILIPKLKTMTIKTAMAFLNSNLFQYLYIQKFGEIKILKGNLSQLPLPLLTNDQNKEIENLVNKVLSGEEQYKEIIDNKIYSLYNLTENEKKHIEVCVNGKTR